MGDVDILEDTTEDSNPLFILFFKEPGCVMNIMVSWMTIDELEGGNMKRKYKRRDGESLVGIFKYRQPF